ncbi:hypothetical protein BRADI_2g43050v3 [Brachypodium distachyon]|uniref:Bifunctional inhibitor/plant lipid transfer protein/seed storage helical domain-containing protein n=1 Tax=Brachypodium distachyon TaxID=15368 RepID=I1HP92_BRADI|nr:hypothetical protein BRADI_2g43050v3 [Brachypodium distachyon]
MGPTALHVVIAVAALLLAAAASAASSQEPPATPCAAAIVAFSPCLAHVAVVAPPAVAAPAPTGACCAAFLRAVSAGDGEGGGGEGCFCHLVRDPLLFGFPVDVGRLGALLPTCASANASAATTVEAEALFADKCRAAVPGPASSPKVEAAQSTTSTPRDRSGSDGLCAFRVSLMALVFTAAVLIMLQLW